MKKFAIALLTILLLGFSLNLISPAKIRDQVTVPEFKNISNEAAIGNPEAARSENMRIKSDDRLVGFYPFNGDANDVSGNSHHGVVAGAQLTSDRFNLVDRAYSFDGIDDAIDLWNGFQYPSMTLCTWIYPIYNNDSMKSIFMEYDSENNFTFGYAPGDSIFASLSTSGEVRWHRWIVKHSIEGLDINNKWMFTAVVINAADDSVYLYLNSKRVASAHIDGNTLPSVLGTVDSTALGCSYVSSIDDYNGKIDDVRIYNDALSQMEIGEIYDIGRHTPWIECNSGVTSDFSSVSVLGTIVWAACENGSIVKTTDDGLNWLTQTSLGNPISDICAVNGSIAFVCVNTPPFTARIYRTIDSGITWTMVYQNTGAGAFMNAVWMFNQYEGYAFGNPVSGSFVLLKTSNGGVSWSYLPSLPQYAGEIGYADDFTWRDRDRGWFGTSSGRVYYTTNGGTSWSYSQTPLNRVFGVSFATHSHGLIGDLSSDNAALTLNGGQTWTNVSPAGTGHGLFPAGAAVPSPQWWAVSDGNIYHLSSTYPLWSMAFTSPAILHRISMKYLPDEDRIVGYVVGDSGIIIKYTEIVPRTSVIGLKYHDQNGNGVKGESDTVMANWTVTLKGLDGLLYDMKNTDETGIYSFTEVPAGEFRIGEILKTDWIQTFPSGGGDHLIMVSTGENIVGLDFGNIFGYRYIGPSTGNWSDSANWTGDRPPGPAHAAIIPDDAHVIVDMIPNDSILALRVQLGGHLSFNTNVGEIKVAGTVQIDQGGILQFSTGAGSSGLICYGDFIDRGSFVAGQSQITMAGDKPKIITREFANLIFNNLAINGENTSLVGNISVLNSMILQKSINSRDGDTVFIENSQVSALSGIGNIPRGTIKRSIVSGPTGQYRFESPLSYLQFTGEGINPASVSVTPLPDRRPVNLRWENRGGIVNVSENTIRVDSITHLSKWPFGIPRPTVKSISSTNDQPYIDPVNRFYSIKSHGGHGWKATVQLRYEQSEILPGTNESQLQLFRGPLIKDYVREKWNMLSLPLMPDDSHKDITYPAAVSDAFVYDGGYMIRDSLRFGEGFWLKFPEAAEISIIGDEINNTVISVNQGWNMIGSISYPISVPDVVSMPPGIIVSGFFKYTTGYEITDSIKPMFGYWVKTSQSGELLLSASGEGFGKSEARLINMEELNKLTFLDRDGNEQSLYFTTDKTIDCSPYEFPPLPPEGCYDVRFASGRMVEINEGNRPKEIAIKISSGKYPIKINMKIVEPDEYNWLGIGAESITLIRNGATVINDSTTLVRLCLGSSLIEDIPKEFAVNQNYPNPFNPVTTIKYQLPADCRVSLEIYNILGQTVQTLIDEVQSAGYKEIEWNASRYATGVYFYKFEAVSIAESHQRFSQVRKLIIIR